MIAMTTVPASSSPSHSRYFRLVEALGIASCCWDYCALILRQLAATHTLPSWRDAYTQSGLKYTCTQSSSPSAPFSLVYAHSRSLLWIFSTRCRQYAETSPHRVSLKSYAMDQCNNSIDVKQFFDPLFSTGSGRCDCNFFLLRWKVNDNFCIVRERKWSVGELANTRPAITVQFDFVFEMPAIKSFRFCLRFHYNVESAAIFSVNWPSRHRIVRGSRSHSHSHTQHISIAKWTKPTAAQKAHSGYIDKLDYVTFAIVPFLLSTDTRVSGKHSPNASQMYAKRVQVSMQMDCTPFSVDLLLETTKKTSAVEWLILLLRCLVSSVRLSADNRNGKHMGSAAKKYRARAHHFTCENKKMQQIGERLISLHHQKHVSLFFRSCSIQFSFFYASNFWFFLFRQYGICL